LSAITKLTVVIPCYNEEDNVRRFAIELFDPILRLVPNSEFLFIDDGSTDDTAARITDLCRTRKEGKLIRHPKNLGLGMAVRTGIEAASGDAVLTLDADLTFHPGEFQKLLNAYSDGVDAVLGSPYLGAMEHVPLVRRLLSHGVNLAYRILLGRKITSTSSLFRLYRASAIKTLTLENRSFDINAEIVFKLIQSGANLVEVPVTLLTRTSGVSKISTAREIRNHLTLLVRVFCWRLGFSR
jgi:dolichol-phosphate mannosyltransferase